MIQATTIRPATNNTGIVPPWLTHPPTPTVAENDPDTDEDRKVSKAQRSIHHNGFCEFGEVPIRG